VDECLDRAEGPVGVDTAETHGMISGVCGSRRPLWPRQTQPAEDVERQVCSDIDAAQVDRRNGYQCGDPAELAERRDTEGDCDTCVSGDVPQSGFGPG
jgi:hypothetical protein